MRSDQDRLLDMLDAMDAIERRAVTKDAFDKDELVRVWCLHHIIIIGEAASRLSAKLREENPTVPWRDMVGMRNAVVHGYFDVDWDEVWGVVERDLKPLREAVAHISDFEANK